MRVAIIFFTLALGILAWVRVRRPIETEARRQLRLEIGDLRETIQLCDAELARPEGNEESRAYIEGIRDGCRRTLEYLERKLDRQG